MAKVPLLDPGVKLDRDDLDVGPVPESRNQPGQTDAGAGTQLGDATS